MGGKKGNPFSVNIKRSATVESLKETIMERIFEPFENLDAHEAILYQKTIENKKAEIENLDLKNVEKLDITADITDYFQNDPPKRFLSGNFVICALVNFISGR